MVLPAMLLAVCLCLSDHADDHVGRIFQLITLEFGCFRVLNIQQTCKHTMVMLIIMMLGHDVDDADGVHDYILDYICV